MSIIVKTCFLGDPQTGKTTIIEQTQHRGPLDDVYVATVGVDFTVKMYIIDRVMIKAQFWDLSGQERFRNICNAYLNINIKTIYRIVLCVFS
ncbi:hypothetical protein EIN_473190 [Entamoeba invadens IP1]|uniref:Uncharacterized protein n=1 Tax=Entamoeba invadens IP1 TaxID=370355 RepID=A0A0A1U6H7_ENTIV|nr:hypothetical protein EIN_473190 [Entamoeba invadens IP1]ELP89911.1 hypothetical protein EIN_473190 [Entamoeba invadens IP1]|eukprot:XP_004256682.1 hypothetical protein EIN_473190 [Entamoeba invadens IP1]